MIPRLIQLHWKTRQHLKQLQKAAEREGAYRVARRLHAIVLNSGGRTSGEVARILESPRSKVSLWLMNYQEHGIEGVLEGHRCGRPVELATAQRQTLADIIESGPVTYGFDCGVWTSPRIARVIEEEFGIRYHPGHVRKLLHQMDFSVQRPRRVLMRADPAKQDRWQRYDYPRLKKARHQGRALIFTDEASFRQDSTLHATWGRVGHPPEVPIPGERKSIKILDAVELQRSRFLYQRDSVFNAQTYLSFLQHQIAPRYRRQGAILIQDNASYHKNAEVWSWFRDNRHWLEVQPLPPYSPQFNPTERLWQHTRKNGTHNRSFLALDELDQTLTRVFGEMQSCPETISAYLQPFR